MEENIKPDIRNTALKAVSYILGLAIIAVGINITKVADLGISPASSLPRAIEAVSSISLGTASTVINVLMVFIQAAILRKRFKPVNILGIPLSIVFGWFIDLFGTDPNAFGHLLVNMPRPQGYPMKLLFLLAGTVVISIGVFLYSRVKWVMLPNDGVGAAIAEARGKGFGDGKTFIDCTYVAIALIIQLVFLGGLKSFTQNVVVREGTVIGSLMVGQAVKFLGKLFDKRKK